MSPSRLLSAKNRALRALTISLSVSCAAASGYGRAGVAINFVTPGQDVEILRAIEGYFRCKISELPPSLGAIA